MTIASGMGRHFSTALLRNALKIPVLCAFLMARLSAQAQVGTAVRELPFDFHPGDLIQVRIQVTPPVGTTNWTVRELYPDRWDFVSSTNASSTNEFSGELIFGPFTNDTARTLAYEVSSIPGLTNSANFTGQIAFNFTTNVVAGTTFLPARNEWLFVGPQTLPQGTVSGVAYGAGRWVAGVYGWLTTLETGGRLTYPRFQIFSGETSARLAYLSGLFLRFGNSDGGKPQMMISDDGLSWKVAQDEVGDSHPDPFAYNGLVRSVAYGNGVFVAVGDHSYLDEALSLHRGAIFRSTNGYNWRRTFRLPITSTNTNTRFIQAVTFADGRFMAVADRGTLLTSTNGSNWAEIQPIHVIGDTNLITTNSVWMTRNLTGICFGPDGWIIPTSLAGTVLRSTDGETWTAHTGTGSAGGPYWQSFYADGKYWFSGFTTVNGTSWTSLPSLSASHPVGPVSRALDGVNPLYLGAGAPAATLVSSTNGTNWTFANSDVTTLWPRFLSVASFSNEWMVAGQSTHPTDGIKHGPSDRGVNVWIPDFGASLVSVRNGGGQWRNIPLSSGIIVYADLLPRTSGVIAAGARRGKVYVNFLGTTNFTALTETQLPAATRTVPVKFYKYPGTGNQNGYRSWEYVNASLAKTSVGYDLFAEAYSDYDGVRILWGHFKSTNGVNWSLRSAGLNDHINFPAIRGLAWGAGRFVAVSEGSSSETDGLLTSTNRIYTSTDGEAYSPVDLAGLAPALNGEGLTGVAYGSGQFVAIGTAGRILLSTNGLDWETVRATDGRRWNRARFLDGVWAAVGNAGWLAFSLDGRTWSSRTAGAESDLTDIAHQNGSYMVVGSHAMVLLSQPVTPAVILEDTLTKLPGAGLQFNVSGHPGKVLDIQATSNFVNWASLLRRTNTTGTAVITDPEPAQERRFYRAVQQP